MKSKPDKKHRMETELDYDFMFGDDMTQFTDLLKAIAARIEEELDKKYKRHNKKPSRKKVLFHAIKAGIAFATGHAEEYMTKMLAYPTPDLSFINTSVEQLVNDADAMIKQIDRKLGSTSSRRSWIAQGMTMGMILLKGIDILPEVQIVPKQK